MAQLDGVSSNPGNDYNDNDNDDNDYDDHDHHDHVDRYWWGIDINFDDCVNGGDHRNCGHNLDDFNDIV